MPHPTTQAGLHTYPSPHHESVYMTQRERPLSPFMLGPYYRWQITSVMSFLHRATGVVLSLGAFLLTVWLLTVMLGPQAHARFMACMGSIPGRIVLAGLAFSLIYHLLNGLRHLLWDMGRGLTIKGLYSGGWTVLVLTVLLTALVVFFGFSAGASA